jgi:hypothetical protein
VLTVVETSIFQKYAADIWSEDEKNSFIDWICEHADAGDVIPGAGGLRKVRWSRAGMGKRGGARIIYFVKTAQGEVWLLIAYAKAKFDNLPAHVLLQWKDSLDG